MEKPIIGIDLVSEHGLSKTSTLVASEEAWKAVIEALVEKAGELLTPEEGYTKAPVSKRDLAIELKTIAEVLKVKTNLKD